MQTRPSVQQQFFDISQALGVLDTPEKQRNYLNFYGNLMKSSDNYLVQVLDTLDNLGLTNDTVVIRTADHGEMGLAHGGAPSEEFQLLRGSHSGPARILEPSALPGSADITRACVAR